MRRPVTTRTHARTRIVAAEHATDDIVRAAARANAPLDLPAPVVADVAIARSHLRAALVALDTRKNSSTRRRLEKHYPL